MQSKSTKSASAPASGFVSILNIAAIIISITSLAIAYFSTAQTHSVFPPTYFQPTHRPNAAMSLSQNTQDFLKALEVRRSTYTLSQESTLSNDAIRQVLETVLEQAPSTFGSFTSRLVLATGQEHLKLWDAVIEIVKNITPADKWEAHTKPRLDGFRNAYGTVLFWEDPTNTKALQQNAPAYADKFPVWSQHTSAIHQAFIWTALTNSGMGVNLQHYNPLIDDKLREMYSLPQEWFLVAQMVFGKPTAPAGPKPTAMKKPMEERLRVFSS
jgi:predicted oxidoreductase (fatty acid repression mutant protein)